MAPLDWCKAPDVGIPDPDRVFYLELSPTAAQERAVYGEERYEKVAFQQQVERQYGELKGEQWMVLDASRDIESLHKDILQETLRVIKASCDLPIAKLWIDST